MNIKSAALSRAAFFLFLLVVISNSIWADVVIREYTEVETEKVYFKNIVETDNKELIEKYGETVIAQSPKPSTTSEISKNYIKLKLKQFGVKDEETVYPSKIVVKRIGLRKAGKEIQEKILERLNEIYLTEGSNAEFEFRISDSEIELPNDEYTIKIESEKLNPSERGEFTVGCAVIINEKVEKRFNIYLSVGERRTVYVLKEGVSRGEKFSLNKIEKREIIDDGKRVYIEESEIEKYQKKVYKFPIKRGEILKAEDFTGLKVIRQNSKVKVVIESEGMAVTYIGRALEDGYLGESVKVMNESSKKIITGIVQENGSVKVELGE